jgi:hypothetical protein
LRRRATWLKRQRRKLKPRRGATEITIRLSSGQQGKEDVRRLAEFVAIIESNKIDIPQCRFGKYITSLTNWPGHPEEAYAEYYIVLSFTAPRTA